MSNSFVEFVKESDGVSLKDFSRDGYQTVIVRVIEETVYDELKEQANKEGYEDYGEYENLETMERVRLFSQNDKTDTERYGIYASV